jgi:hypothetical protein
MIPDYQVLYSDRKTISITVERDRRVVVRAPNRATEQAVNAIVERKRYWIWQKRRDPRKYPSSPYRKEFVPGETFLYLGYTYQFDYAPDEQKGLHLVSRTFLLPRHQRPQAHSLFCAWYKIQAKTHLLPRVSVLASAFGLKYRRITVRDLKYSWASCTASGTLTFNWRIIQAPPFVVDYLLVHELAHLLEHNHTPEFWNIVAVHAPGYQKARNWLLHHGDKLEW